MAMPLPETSLTFSHLQKRGPLFRKRRFRTWNPSFLGARVVSFGECSGFFVCYFFLRIRNGILSFPTRKKEEEMIPVLTCVELSSGWKTKR